MIKKDIKLVNYCCLLRFVECSVYFPTKGVQILSQNTFFKIIKL